jgi:hypothetical protein
MSKLIVARTIKQKSCFFILTNLTMVCLLLISPAIGASITLTGEYNSNNAARTVVGSGNRITFSNILGGSGTITASAPGGVVFSGSVASCWFTRIRGNGNSLEFYGSSPACWASAIVPPLPSFRGSISISGATASGDVTSCISGVTQQGFRVIRGNGNSLDLYSVCGYQGSITFSPAVCTGPVSISWTDPVITADTTKIRKVHIDELRSWINNRRADAGLSAYPWTDPTITAGSTKIRKVHIDEMRTAINEVYIACGQTPPTWTDPTITAGSTKIRKVHIDELRSATANAL